MGEPGGSASANVDDRSTGWLETDLIDPILDFRDPGQEWRRLFSEALGTFMLVLVAAGGGMMGQAFPDTISRAAATVAAVASTVRSGSSRSRRTRLCRNI